MTDDNIDEVDVELDEYDIDHLRGGQPVFKAIDDDTRLVLRFRGWDDYE